MKTKYSSTKEPWAPASRVCKGPDGPARAEIRSRGKLAAPKVRGAARVEARGSSSAFTLVELMVVVGIIAVLISIVLPSINAARVAAKVATTRATIATLETGLAQFRANQQVGGGNFPPSYYFGETRPLLSPHDNTPLEEPYLGVGGAGLLVWALAGADLLGTPGFRDLNGNDPQTGALKGMAAWADDTHRNVGGLYELYTGPPNGVYSTDQPMISRSGPFVEISKMRFPKLDQNVSAFRIPGAKAVPSGNPGLLSTLCFLDTFDQPILYYRANRAGQFPFDSQSVSRGIYNPYDNRNITGQTGGGTTDVGGMDLGAGPFHRLGYQIPHPLDVITDWRQTSPTPRWPSTPPGAFARQLWNPNVTATLKPYNTDSYVLLSAGPDALFGTADDVANFDVNKGKE